ncbi:zinc-binding dehydrogenase [Paeniglutamicibacter terrestris]|uniref:Alcohol dehydrogenase catalytic domain-containing protein n=1 Tax=Paeniglutamicibacter terrestris TaxID=2723403 RepID=A0ABX1G169_9MICC|nr:zinc-binding dehydrogenase [Paeniglutamicibacter terrestris]NKG19704.1 alcohol dehydrogenase catalytic domain-containing protein [Paeniglutamicibacter terrestris]
MGRQNVRAAVVRDFDGRFAIEGIEIDSPLGAEVLIEVRAVGLCHSDLHLASTNMGIPAPLLLGHEISGVISQLGDRVSGLAVGEHVVATLIQYCGRCSECLSGAGHRCKQGAQTLRTASAPARVEQAGSGVTQMFGLGGFAELALVHENQVVKIPAEIPFAQAAVMACSTLTGAGAVFNCAKVAPGENVVILGAGGVGLNAINAARIAGAQRIIAVDLAEDKLELARRFGATHTVNAASQDPVDAVLELSGGGVHHAFEMIGFPATSLQALRMTRTGGHAYLIGLHRPGSTLEIDVMADVIGPQRSLHGLYMGSSAPQRDVPRYVDQYLSGTLELDALVANELSLDQINDGFAAMASGGGVDRGVITSF